MESLYQQIQNGGIGSNPEFPPGPSGLNWKPYRPGPIDENDFCDFVRIVPGWLPCPGPGLSNDEMLAQARNNSRQYMWRNLRTPGADGQLWQAPLQMQAPAYKHFEQFM